MPSPRALNVVLLLVSVTAWVTTAGAPTARTGAAIDATGRDDVTAELQALIDDTPNGGVIELGEAGDYRVEGTLLLSERHDLTIDGNGARLFATTTGDGSRSHLRLVGGSDLVVHDLEIGGANPYAGLDDRSFQVDLVGQHGIRLEGVTGVELARVRVVDVYGDFVYIGRRDDGRWSEQVWVHDSFFARSGRQGLSVTAGRDVVIERNIITHTRRATIDLEPNSPAWGARNVHILDNEIGPGRLLFVAAAGAGPVDEVVVARNQLRGHLLGVTVQPPGTDRRAGFYVVDNTSDSPATRPPIRFTQVDGVVVAGNTQPMVRPGEALVQANDVCGLVVTGNDLRPGILEIPADLPTCGALPAIDVPAAPSVAGRPIGGASPSTVATTAAPETTAPAPVPTPDPSTSTDGEDGLMSDIAIVAMVGIVTALVVWGALSGWRRARRGDRRRPERLRQR